MGWASKGLKIGLSINGFLKNGLGINGLKKMGWELMG